jgi:hypothetical protein
VTGAGEDVEGRTEGALVAVSALAVAAALGTVPDSEGEAPGEVDWLAPPQALSAIKPAARRALERCFISVPLVES